MNDQVPVPASAPLPASAKETPLKTRSGALQRELTAKAKKRFWTSKRIWIAVGSVAALFLIYLIFFSGGSGEPNYVTAEVTRGPMTVTVSATGTLEPTNEVDVGAETNGRVAEVLVDFNDRVTKGQVLARLDTEQLNAKLAQSRASLSAAQATVRQAEATLAESRTRANRVTQMFQHNVASRQDMETAQADQKRAVATLEKTRADAALAAAMVSQDQTALSKTEIRAPIDGIVLTRNIEPGTTLAVQLQMPVLFKIASDLSQMELKIDIDEADVGSVREGQTATFTVDAFPQRRFTARLTSLRNSPKTEAGVVTYEGVLTVDNSGRLLRPGLTANADILVASIDTALLVPNGALRFTPPEDIVGAAPPPPARRNDGQMMGRVWVLNGLKPEPRDLRVGRSDGHMTEVVGGNLRRGEKVITDIAAPGTTPPPQSGSR
jgi:HlyD family secretion protein